MPPCLPSLQHTLLSACFLLQKEYQLTFPVQLHPPIHPELHTGMSYQAVHVKCLLLHLRTLITLQFFKHFFDKHPLIHRILHTLNLLIILMTFTRKNNNITRFTMFYRILNSFFSVCNINMLSGSLSNSSLDIFYNCLRLFKSWII